MINKHGLIINGLRAASGRTQADQYWYRVYYNRGTGETWTCAHGSRNNYFAYDDRNIISVGSYNYHLTMQQIADIIARRVAELEALGA